MRHSLICLLLLILMIPSAAAAQEKYVVGLSCPENTTHCIMEMFVPFYHELYRRAGASAEIVVLPRLRDLQAADSGCIDATALCTPEVVKAYPHLVALPTPMAQVNLRCFILDPEVRVDVAEDLGSLTVAVLRGEIISQNVAERFAGKVYLGNGYEQLFQMLQSKHVDVVLASEIGGRIMAERIGLPHLIESPVIATSSIHHCINRMHEEELLPVLDTALAGMLRDGSARELLPDLFR